MKPENKSSINYYIKRLDYFENRIIPIYKGPNLYDETDTNYPVFQNILNLLDSNQLSGWQMSTGRKLDSIQRLARLFHFHKSAVEAEVAQKTERANFFWTETYEVLEDALKFPDKYKWAVVFQNEDTINEHTQGLITQIFIDTHCAFYNEIIRKITHIDTDCRAFKHIKYLEKLLVFTKLSKQDQFNLFEPAIKQELQILKANKNWAAIVNRCNTVIDKYVANDFMLETMLSAQLTKAYRELGNGTSNYNYLNDAEKLNNSLNNATKKV